MNKKTVVFDFFKYLDPVITVHSNTTVGDTCFEDSECYSAIVYTVCVNSSCACDNGYIFDGEETCIPSEYYISNSLFIFFNV